MAQVPVFSEAQEFWLLLEKERTDVTYKPKVECKRPHASEVRDQMLYSAGRYAAGARDKVAVRAHEQLMQELSQSV